MNRDATSASPGKNDNGPADIQGKDAILRYLKAAIAYARKAMSRVEVSAVVSYYSYNHYGQMVVYARMNGVPPASQR